MPRLKLPLFLWPFVRKEIELRLPYNWKPREYQKNLWGYLARGGKRAVCRYHRRAGKDEVFLHHTACAAHERVGNYWYCLPEYSQARKSMWDAVNPHSGKRRIDEAFPVELRKFTRDHEMMIGFSNGSTFQLVGSDNFDSLVGSPPVGLVFSEFALSDPSAWAYLEPILMENGGWAGFNSTPRGNNHFKNLCLHAEKTDSWFYEALTAEQTGVFTKDQLEEILHGLQAIHGEDYGKSLWLQEYFVSFDAAIPGSIWGDCIDKAQREGRIGDFPFDPSKTVSTAWDLGRTDATAIWFYQFVGNQIHVIDHHESNLKDIEFYANLLKEKSKNLGYKYGTHWFPHDARPRTLASGGKSILQQFIAHDIGRCVIAKRLDKMEQIQAARATFPFCSFDAKRCDVGINALRNYHREWDESLKKFTDHPIHDWSSHSADGFSILSLTWKFPKEKQPDSPLMERIQSHDIHKLNFGQLKKQHFSRKQAERELRFEHG